MFRLYSPVFLSDREMKGVGEMPVDLQHCEADLGDVRLHYVEVGSGPLVVLLHGFPEFWYSWRHQLPVLAAAGFRVVAPDMRGYNLSSKPRSVAAYRLPRLSGDVARLIHHLGSGKAVVIGHDWGAVVAWDLAQRYPERVERLVIMNVPHPERFARGLLTCRQLLRSWYIFFFQIPWLPEALTRLGNFAVIRRILQTDPVRPSAFSPSDIGKYMEAIARPGALTAAINYYRAAMRDGLRVLKEFRRIEAPVLVIWGQKDRYLGAELAEPAAKWVPNVRVERLTDASHWVQIDQPARVNALVLDFLSSCHAQKDIERKS